MTSFCRQFKHVPEVRTAERSLISSVSLCLCLCVCHPHPPQLPAGPPKARRGKETLRFCTMNDLLRQAHPNTLVPGVDRPLCTIRRNKLHGTCFKPRRAGWLF